MSRSRTWILLAAGLLLAGGRLQAQPRNVESRAFDKAVEKFRQTFYEQAESEFAQFVETYTNSARLPEAILYQAEARLQQSNYAGAIQLLSTSQSRAGKWADQYLFWQAQARLRQADYSGAAEDFARLLREFPGSSASLDAVIGEATAHAKLSQWGRVVELLGSSNGFFQGAARTNAAGQRAPSGYLLLSEAQLELRDYEAAETALRPLANIPLAPQMDWQRQYLVCRIDLAKGQTAEALSGASNLVALASGAGQRALQAESISFEGSLLERLGRTEEAIAAYTNNLVEGVPSERQGQALLHVTQLLLAQGESQEAAKMLQQFVNKYPRAPGVPQALLSLGELRLRQEAAAWESNSLSRAAAPALALTNAVEPLRALIRQFPQSPLMGKAQLDLGWCFWFQTNLPQCAAAFQAAIQGLAPSADLATAHFKLGDAQYGQTNFAGALTNYQAVIDLFEHHPELAPADHDMLATNLLERALYQAVRAALGAGDMAAATNAMAKLLAWYPHGFHTDRAVLLAGQAVGQQGSPAAAREIFQAFEQQAPDAPLAPQVKLAIAHTYEEQTNWDEAIAQYDGWLATFTNHEDQPYALFYRAWANSQAGRDTNALVQFTNLVAQFPTHALAARAQYWVGCYFFRSGNPVEAERNFQLLFRSTNWPPSELTWQAQMMAGRAAVAQQHWNDATNYFVTLANTQNCPAELRARAMFALGDTIVSMGDPSDTNKVASYLDAISVFDGIGRLYPSNQLAVLALGQKANCLLQWARTPQQYEQASNAFQQVIDCPRADPATRSQAKVGLGSVLEKLADLPAQTNTMRTNLLTQALVCYTDVVTQDPPEDPGPDSAYWFWVGRAGKGAVRVLERFQDWQRAISVCDRMAELVPPLRATFEERKKRDQQNLEAAEKSSR